MAAFGRLANSATTAAAAAAAARLAYASSQIASATRRIYPSQILPSTRRTYSSATISTYSATAFSASTCAAAARRAAAYGPNAVAGGRAAAYGTNAVAGGRSAAYGIKNVETVCVPDDPSGADIHLAASRADEDISPDSSLTPTMQKIDEGFDISDTELEEHGVTDDEEEGFDISDTELEEHGVTDDEEEELFSHFGMGSADELGEDGLPVRVDWRRRGAVTPVQNQGPHCRSCYAFATVGAIEGINYKETKRLIKLSEQQIVDGSNVNNLGCDGGYLVESFEYAIKAGVVPAKYYPYVGVQRKFKNVSSKIITISGFKMISGEAALKRAVAQQPVAACIDANVRFQNYKSGVLYGETSGWKALDHCVLVVGYDITPWGQEYWILKNSQGRYFGRLGGYVHLARGVFPKGGTLGIARLCVFPVKKVPNTVGMVKSESQMGVKLKFRKSWP